MTSRRPCPARRALLLAAAASCLAAPAPAAGNGAGTAFFEAKIRPVLARHCYACHSADAAKANRLKAGLYLDTAAGLRKGGESGPAVVPGRPEAGLLLRSLRHAAGAPKMPPAGKLPAAVVADFEQWVRMGAPDPRSGAAAAPKKGMTVAEGRRFWSFRPPAAAAPPPVRDGAWPRGAIDRFVLAKLEEKRLRPVRDADPRTLIRRLHFDLVGLPPDPEEVEAFAREMELPSAAGDPYARLVDRLLASPHFGERWGRHWLDGARYADSNGRDRNRIWFHAWRYRDYVIRAFNEDRPYDRFLREQVAGDLLPAATPEQWDEQRIATGFLALGAKAFEEQKPEVFRMDLIDEQIEVVGRAVLGLSIGCARCHDHKYDPIPTRDYYALAGIFRSTETLYGHAPLGVKAISQNHSSFLPVGRNAEALAGPALAYYERLKEAHLTFQTARSDRYRVVRRVADAKTQLQKPGADRAALQAGIDRMEAEIREWDARVKALETALEALIDAAPREPGWAMGVRERPAAENCRVHVRGETTNLGEEVPRGVLQVIPLPGAAPPAGASGRRELAEWLAHRENPLTARVLANRAWMHLFGRGLVATPDDFGVTGARPTHSELLDYLAVRFMEGGWSVKGLVREIALSRAYRLASDSHAAGLTADPENLYYWRMRPRRLDAEVFRDAILAVSGELDRSPPARQFLDRFHPRRDDEYRAFRPMVTPAAIEHAHRSVYLPVVRGVLPELFALFDFAAPERPVLQREESTVPAQALYLMNSPWVIGRARLAARRLLAEPGPDDAARVERLYRLALSRAPAADETAAALAYLDGAEEPRPDPKTQAPPDAARQREERWTSLCQVLLASAEFRYLR